MNKSIYLAGGMRNGWQDIFITKSDTNNFIIYDPRKHEQSTEKNYTSWDINAIKKSDIILGHIEKDNPSGYGLCLEIGYAKAFHKTIIWVQDKEDERSKYFGMSRELADYVFYDLNEAILFINKNSNIL